MSLGDVLVLILLHKRFFPTDGVCDKAKAKATQRCGVPVHLTARTVNGFRGNFI